MFTALRKFTVELVPEDQREKDGGWALFLLEAAIWHLEGVQEALVGEASKYDEDSIEYKALVIPFTDRKSVV